ncbi:site-specific DNA-methyltransferase [Fluoribacter gormanii]|uniref:site-specific DNA-methyltransferase (adenine-specific) n=1 Tax=Fluoribacter gormanii TaxID=464 RepID=A0A377GG89_9GAMM|nr:site-specific DNA-methyltransferase [Fluoribacter gormanii]KTD02761.1 DNA methylase [Fluoribacter gormanii]SIR59056.1 adenine-specific DNA-methyltransferase [Fluoribacter gormanii]STO23778.1 Adenine specific DNA methylase Mod [Fluoribacter gormanii]
MNSLKMHSKNITEDNIEKIASLFPNCLTEAIDAQGQLRKKIDFDLLRQELSREIVEGPQERYQLNWPGKRQSLLTANSPIAKTLRPCREESVDFDKTKNLFIEGDNLDALKLLQETYLGKVKMIYIDPPYNTGNDFIYNDNFTESIDDYLHNSGQKDNEDNRLIANKDSNGRFHSNWLSMMYSRLKLARNLLKDDGIIFISIDDNEVNNLKKICDEIFSEENCIGILTWKNKYGAGAKTKGFIEVHEYILCYSKKDINNISSKLNQEQINEYKNKDDKFMTRGGFVTQPLMTNSLDDRDNLQYSIKYNEETITPRKQWVWSKARLLEAIKNDEVVFKKKNNGEYSVRAKVYLKDENGKIRKGKPLSLLNGPFNQEGTKEVEELLGKNIFSFPKPLNLIKYLFSFTVNDKEENDGIYLDFFSGSSTSAHALFDLNAEDGGNRKFIQIQLPEKCDNKSTAFKNKYTNIAEISKERIRRAGIKIKEENANKEYVEKLDIGFRVLKIDSSNMTDVYYTSNTIYQDLLTSHTDNVKPDRTPEDLLFQVLLDWGVGLSLPIAKKIIHDREVFFVDEDALVACFDNNGKITEEFVKELTQYSPLRVVFRDACFASDNVKINVTQIFKQLSPHTEVKTI